MDVFLETRDLTKVYDGRAVVDGLDWKLGEGEACALLGPNGAGKTTTLRMVMGFTPPSRGTFDLFGVDGWDPPAAVRERIAHVSEHPVLPPWMVVGDLIRFHAGFYMRWDARLEKELRDRFAIEAKKRVSTLSKGQHQRLMLLLALCQGSELLLLDEPASGLDVEVRRTYLSLLGEYLGEGGRSLVFSTHLLTDVERIATRVLVLRDGRAIEDASLDELQEDVRVVTLSNELYERTRPTWEAAGILHEERGNGTVSLTVRRYRGAPSALVSSLSPSSIDASPLPFEEIYLALTRADLEESA